MPSALAWGTSVSKRVGTNLEKTGLGSSSKNTNTPWQESRYTRNKAMICKSWIRNLKPHYDLRNIYKYLISNDIYIHILKSDKLSQKTLVLPFFRPKLGTQIYAPELWEAIAHLRCQLEAFRPTHLTRQVVAT